MEQSNDWFILLKEGDNNAFRTAFDLYYRKIVIFAFLILRDKKFAEDMANESFAKAWQRRERHASPRHLENFLYIATRNACISHLRKKKTIRKSQDDADIFIEAQEEIPPAEVERIHAELIARIGVELEALKEEGEIIKMSFLEGKSTEEIARLLKISKNTVYIKKSRGLKTLKRIFSPGNWPLPFLNLLLLYAFG